MALRVYGRMMATPSLTFVGQPSNPSDVASVIVYEPPVSGQVFVGVTYYP